MLQRTCLAAHSWSPYRACREGPLDVRELRCPAAWPRGLTRSCLRVSRVSDPWRLCQAIRTRLRASRGPRETAFAPRTSVFPERAEAQRVTQIRFDFVARFAAARDGATPLRQTRLMAAKKNKLATQVRCWWSGEDPQMVRYHDTEWGVPVHDDRMLFEFLTLEGAQAGLSWSTILRKREAYKKAFAEFDVERVARFTEKKLASLMLDPGIVRNRLKLGSTVKNARAFLRVQEEFGSFSAYQWRFVDGTPLQNAVRTRKDIVARTEISDALSKDLKKRGFSFVGSTIMYAHMQAVGMVNDHWVECFRHAKLAGKMTKRRTKR